MVDAMSIVESVSKQGSTFMINPSNVIPMVIDNSGRGERAYDIYSLLLKELSLIHI